MKNIQFIAISKHGFITVALILIQLVLLRFTLPYGDEPDFTIRSLKYTFSDYIDSNHDSITHILSSLNVMSNCKIDASPFSIWGSIDHASCTENLGQILKRIFLQFIIIAPILFFLIFRSFGIFILHGLTNKSTIDLNEKIEVLGFSMLIPGMMYYLGLMSPENLSLMLSLLIYLFWGSIVFIFALFVLIIIVDFGNSIVVASFMIYFSINYFIAKISSFRWSLLFSLACVLFALFAGEFILYLVDGYMIVGDKATAMIHKNELENLRDKYPVLFRPFITYMTMVFMMPSGLKIVLIYLLYAIPFLFGLKKIIYDFIINKKIVDQKKSLEFLTALTFVLSFVYMFPDYNNAKYYMFLIPFFCGPIFMFFNKYNVLWYMFLSFMPVPIFLLLFRI